MHTKHKWYYALAALHLLMVALFAAHFSEWGYMAQPWAKAMSAAGNYTGSNNIFSFFAPRLSNQPYVVYTVEDAAGKERMIDLTGSSPDFGNRLSNVYGFCVMPEARSILSAGLAQEVARRNPGARKIRVAMVVQQIPGMAAFRHGKRCYWRYWFHRDYQVNSAMVKN